jgi:hypothetical protein
MSADKKAPVVLKASDDGQYTVERAVAEKSGLIKMMIEGEFSPMNVGSRGGYWILAAGWLVGASGKDCQG